MQEAGTQVMICCLTRPFSYALFLAATWPWSSRLVYWAHCTDVSRLVLVSSVQKEVAWLCLPPAEQLYCTPGLQAAAHVWVGACTVHWRALSIMFPGSNVSTGQSNQSKHAQ